jgi:hypothetical protein
VIPSLVLRIVGFMFQAHREFEVFDHPDLDLTQFIEERIFIECDQVLVSWLHGVEPRLT